VNAGVQKAVELVGGQSALAKRMGGPVKQGHVWKWLRMDRIPAERAIAIERATDGRVTRQELRPDLFGEPEPKPKPRKKAA
jgi:DNA-binding transcriptional regulator YdaS (Cro superfamily)